MSRGRWKTSKKYTGVRQQVGSTTWMFRLHFKGQDYCGSGYATAKEASEAREQMKVELRTKGSSNVNCIKKFSDVYKEFIDEQSLARSYSSLKKYDSLFRVHMEPFFGNMLIKNITANDVENFFRQFAVARPDKKHGKLKVYSNEYLDGFRKLLNNVFNTAIKKRYIFFSPMTGVSKDVYTVGRDKEEGIYLKPDVISKIEYSFRGTNNHLPFMLGYHLGLRISEAYGLMWSDVDFVNKTVTIERQLIFVDDMWCFAPLKTSSAYRTIKMTSDLYLYLSILKEVRQKERQELGDRYVEINNLGILIKNNDVKRINRNVPLMNVSKDGTMLTPNNFKGELENSKALVGIDWSFHDLRHTHATMCVENNMPVNELKLRMGHKKITTTMQFYNHNTEKSDEKESYTLQAIKIKDIQEVHEEEAYNAYLSEDIEESATAVPNITSAEILGGSFATRGFVPSTK